MIDDRTAPLRDLARMSQAERFALRKDWRTRIADMPADERDALLYRWSWWRRPAQSVPAQMGTMFRIWLVKAGRGYGKTRTGAETVREQIKTCGRIALVAPTAADARDVMIEGESGIMSVFPPGEMPRYEPSKRRITFYNGAIGTAYSAEEPDRLRGPQHEWAWGDEPASWKYGDATMTNLRLGNRLGKAPWVLLTGTPKPTKWLRGLSEEETTVITNGNTYENVANLASTFIDDVLGRYEGSRLGRQEIHGEWLDDIEGALWTMKMIDDGRVNGWKADTPYEAINDWLIGQGRNPIVNDRRPWRIIVAVDPPGETAECGIAVGAAPVGAIAGRDHAVLLDDMSIAGRPEIWGAQVVNAARRWSQSGHPCKVYVESNQGGDMVRSTVHGVDRRVTVEKINARISKTARADPVSALYPRWVHHAGFFPEVESQMTTWVAGGKEASPDRMDALVHLFRTALATFEVPPSRVESPARSSRRVPTP